MDGRVYNYNGGTWNACGENFQTTSLDLHNPAPISRESHMMRDPSKAMASASSFMFLNYLGEEQIHQSNQHIMHQTHWQLPQWPKMKPHQVHGHKNTAGLMKDDWSGMATTNMHAGPSLFNIPPPGPFCSAEMTDRLLDNLHDPSNMQQNPSMATYVGDNRTNNVLETPQQMQTTQKSAVKKSNPQPRKRREKKKPDKEKKKRTRNEDSWARNKRKKARAKGEEYMSVVGKMMRAKEVQPVDCSKCKFHCPDHVSEEERQKLFKHYWSLESFKDKVNFLSACVEEFVPLRPISGKRLHSRRYKLKVGEGDDEKEARVCKEFFISTFDISESTIVTFMNKKRKNPEEIKDNRGHQIPSNKTPPEVVTSIREHILSQTGLQGCLSKSQSEEVKNMKRLYTHYQAECEAENKKTASMSVYRKVYGDMHKDKTEAPVILPPDEVLDSISPAKKSKPSKPDPPAPVAYLDNTEDDNDDANEPLSVEPLNLSPPNIPTMPLPPPQATQQQQQQQPVSSSSSMNIDHHGNLTHSIMHPNQQHHSLPAPRPSSQEKSYALNIPMSHSSQQQQQLIVDNISHAAAAAHDSSLLAPSFDPTTGAHLNQLMPFMWGAHRVPQPPPPSCSQQHDLTGLKNIQSSYGVPSTFPITANPPNSMHPVNQSCLFSNPNNPSGGGPVFPNTTTPVASMPLQPPLPPPPASVIDPSLSMAIQNQTETLVAKKPKKPRASNKSKPKKEVKKRTRNEEGWGRNIRKRLRFKGEEYISVKGKTVGAKTIQDVDCSKCKYKCKTKVTEEQRIELNSDYWSLENYQKRIEFISKNVQTYVPKRKMTGRRAFSRNYTFIINDKEVRVCKNFFITTLHISESIVATCLKKARKGPSAVKDMRGKHKPVNKTPEDVLQNIRELIIYLTGVRPKRKGNTSSKIAEEYQDINRLYLIYKYDSEKKGKKIASQGIFRSVLLSEFGFTGNTKFKKSLLNKMTSLSNKVEENNRKDTAPGGKASSQHGGGNPKGREDTTGVQAPEGDTDGDRADKDRAPTLPESVEVTEGSSTHPVFSTCLLSTF